jgi:hypothetical protein
MRSRDDSQTISLDSDPEEPERASKELEVVIESPEETPAKSRREKKRSQEKHSEEKHGEKNEEPAKDKLEEGESERPQANKEKDAKELAKIATISSTLRVRCACVLRELRF